jgi:hypothetical protein
MARFRYYLSHDPGTLSPPTEELLSIEADSRAEALERIKAGEGAPNEWSSVWAHLLVWASVNGGQRGFESTRLRCELPYLLLAFPAALVQLSP